MVTPFGEIVPPTGDRRPARRTRTRKSTTPSRRRIAAASDSC